MNHAEVNGKKSSLPVNLQWHKTYDYKILTKWFYLYDIEITHVVATDDNIIKIQTDNENGDKKAK